jgi:hypothetical protein
LTVTPSTRGSTCGDRLRIDEAASSRSALHQLIIRCFRGRISAVLGLSADVGAVEEIVVEEVFVFIEEVLVHEEIGEEEVARRAG